MLLDQYFSACLFFFERKVVETKQLIVKWWGRWRVFQGPDNCQIFSEYVSRNLSQRMAPSIWCLMIVKNHYGKVRNEYIHCSNLGIRCFHWIQHFYIEVCICCVVSKNMTRKGISQPLKVLCVRYSRFVPKSTVSSSKYAIIPNLK